MNKEVIFIEMIQQRNSEMKRKQQDIFILKSETGTKIEKTKEKLTANKSP